MVKILKWVVGLPVAGLVFLLVLGAVLKHCDSQPVDAKSMSRMSIEQCWDNQRKKSNSAGESQFIAGACESMEAKFKETYKVSP